MWGNETPDGEGLPFAKAAFEHLLNASNLPYLDEGLAPWAELDWYYGPPTREDMEFNQERAGLLSTRVHLLLGSFHYVRDPTLELSSFSFDVIDLLERGDAVFKDRHDPPSQAMVDYLLRGALRTWEDILHSLSVRVEEGAATVYGRPRSPLSPMERIPPDVWRHFTMIDWRTGVAQCEVSGDRLFSVCVRLADGAAAPVLTRRPTPEDQQALQQEFDRRRVAHLPPLTREETEAWARDRGLSRDFARSFRAGLPESSKLSPGEKRSDWRGASA